MPLKIQSISSLADALRISLGQLERLCASADSLYCRKEKPKKSGGVRVIHDPRTRLKVAQKRLLRLLESQIQLAPAAMGGIKGKTVKSNAAIHVRQQCVVNIDITDFFGNIRRDSVVKSLRMEGYGAKISEVIATLVTFNNVVPQGAPTSMFIGNLVLKQIDLQVLRFGDLIGVSYSRWVDDHTVSGSYRQARRMERLVRALLLKEGFSISEKKFRVMRAGTRQEVTGQIVNRDRPTAGKAYSKKLQDDIRRVSAFGATEQEVNNLRGRIAWITSTNPSKAKKFRAALKMVHILAESRSS